MDNINPDSFAMVCFLVLMQNGEGLIDKSPDYIGEKTHLLRAGYNAFAYLDIYNMRKVIKWLEAWKIEAPEVIAKEMALQEQAALELRGEGFIL